MDDVRFLLGLLTGLEFLQPGLPLGTLIPTGALIHLTDGIIAMYFAGNRARSKPWWFLLGLAFGIWGLVVFFLLPKRAPERSRT